MADQENNHDELKAQENQLRLVLITYSNKELPSYSRGLILGKNFILKEENFFFNARF